MSKSPFEVFISFSATNGDFVDRLSQGLRQKGCSSFSSRDLMVGDDWAVETRNALKTSRFVLLVMSPQYFTSGWTVEEWSFALERERQESRIIILPVLLEKCELPAPLMNRTWADFREGRSFDEELAKLIRAIRRSTPPNSEPKPNELRFVEAAPAPALPIPPDLIQSCLSGECVLFAGAGLSARAGVPTWSQFLRDLLNFAIEQQVIDSSYAQSLEAALDEGERDAAADGIVQMFASQRESLQTFLQQYFLNAGPASSAHHWLQQIQFSSVITNNYDRLLEEAFPEYAQEGLFTPKEAEPLLDALSQKRRFILKLYGLIERLETLIFAPIEYREALSSNISFSKFMEGIFFSRTFFFVGLSLEGIQDFLSGFVFRGMSPRKHFALVAVTGSAWKAKAELLQRRYNIEVIPFPVSQSFPEVEAFLEQLSHAVRPVASHQTQAPVLPGLKRVVLEDIGPFERLELDFPSVQDDSTSQTRWKILLGDNGVGKSTILKAIAVAIMGNDARSFAARLVRTGKTKGRITLYTEHNPVSGYITEILTKDMLSEAEIVSLPSRPMEAEGWLALGFSPLRVVTWASSTGPQPIVQKGRPTADDLLPLISGEADPRMDRLKQWIVNLDSLDKPGRPRVLTGHTARVSTIVFTPDGRTLISGSVDNTIRFWDCRTEIETRRISGHNGGVNSLALNKDGSVLASGSFDRVASTWRTALGEQITSFRGSLSQILSVSLNAEGTSLVTASESGSIRVWNHTGGERLKYGSGGSVWCVALSPDGSTIAAGTYAGTINLNKTENGELIRSISVGRGVVMGIAWSTDGQRLICGSKNGPVSVWDSSTGTMIREFVGADTRTIAISQDGRTVAAGSEHGELKVWDLESGQELMNIQAHVYAIWSVAVSPDGKTVASASEDCTIKLWPIPGATAASDQQETIRRFFKLVGVVTDRKDIEFLEVRKDYRVMVKVADSADGVLLEQLSQGMTSLFGWIGVLCQRLKETLQVATNDPLPTNSYALVLIDELDAHMHPRWQQVLVHRLKKAFPNVQFIACTHSPLIASGLDKVEVDRFTLRKKKIVKVDFEPDMTLGRFDQILTGELFGLKTTLDPATQEMMAEYEDLLGEPERDQSQELRFLELGRTLEERIPPTPSNLVARRAGELLEALRFADNDDVNPRVRERMTQLSKALRGDA